MKKLFLMLGLVLMISLASCKNEGEHRRTYNDGLQKNVETEYPYHIYEITYKEHDYIIFSGVADGQYGQYGRSGMHSGAVHNPDCRKCNNH